MYLILYQLLTSHNLKQLQPSSPKKETETKKQVQWVTKTTVQHISVCTCIFVHSHNITILIKYQIPFIIDHRKTTDSVLDKSLQSYNKNKKLQPCKINVGSHNNKKA